MLYVIVNYFKYFVFGEYNIWWEKYLGFELVGFNLNKRIYKCVYFYIYLNGI